MHVVFTDLDGTLLNHHDYRHDAAMPLIQQLQEAQIPVIPVTSKTRCEVESWVTRLGLTNPFVVENGSGILIPQDYSGFQIPIDASGLYHVITLGCSYAEARQGLRQLEQVLDQTLQGFGDLATAEIQALTSLSQEEAQLAQTREFSEPFVPPTGISASALSAAAQTLGFRILTGGRFCHLIGQNAGKGKAVQWLVQQYQNVHPQHLITTMGLGDSPNDLEMLEVVDHPRIIPGKMGQPHPQLLERGWTAASAPAPEGWVEVVEAMLSKTIDQASLNAS